ncbi:MAG TPA: amino acid ABC transporter substrate-binding protein [Burkholderiales bacterium]|jgi:general L-amino acid transport system substrate-binding protein|nr:amino acid ABC transporter substrate-binding protein [Burkholderiales bacterium]
MTSRCLYRLFAYAVGAALLATAMVLPAQAGETTDGVKARGRLRCGVSEGIVGFSARDASGRWTGLDADFCRALAAAVLGDPEKVEFRPLKASERFPALNARAIDVLARNTSWTMSREVLLNVRFPGVLFYDAQGFMVGANSGVKTAADLKGATICVVKGTTHVEQMADYFDGRGDRIVPLVIDSEIGAADAFFAGKCRALTSDASQLAAARLRAPGGPTAFVILPERISKEPLGAAVRGGDDGWFMTVRWVLFALIAAEENGITQANVEARMSGAHSAIVRRLLGYQKQYARALGVRPDWMVRAIRAAGNYGEIFERNVGGESALKLDRGPNRLWTQGGLMYAPPLR